MSTMREVSASEMQQVEGGTYIGWGMAIGAAIAIYYGGPILYNWVKQQVVNFWHSHMSHTSNYGTSHYSYDNSPGHLTFNDYAPHRHF